MDNPHHLKEEVHGVEETMLSCSRQQAAGAGYSHPGWGNVALGLCSPMQWGNVGCL